jgi:hypothetical protein
VAGRGAFSRIVQSLDVTLSIGITSRPTFDPAWWTGLLEPMGRWSRFLSRRDQRRHERIMLELAHDMRQKRTTRLQDGDA